MLLALRRPCTRASSESLMSTRFFPGVLLDASAAAEVAEVADVGDTSAAAGSDDGEGELTVVSSVGGVADVGALSLLLQRQSRRQQILSEGKARHSKDN